jgi:aryl-alcohol dehydrogenase
MHKNFEANESQRGISMNIIAAISRSPGAAFSLEQVTLEAPRQDEIVVRIAGVGLCHSDLLARDGILPMSLPAVFGHEGSGEVVAIGDAVTKIKPGDRVVLTFDSCHACHRCTSGEPAYCDAMAVLNYAGGRPDGTTSIHSGAETIGSHFFGQSSFATFALCSERNAIVVPNDVAVELMGPLGCGIQTGAGAIINSMACKPGSSLLVSGGGSVGLSALLAGIVQGCKTLIVVEPHASRRALALSLGATHVVDPSAGDTVAAVRAILPHGVGYALDSTGLPHAVSAAQASLGMRGTLALVGVPPSTESTSPLPLLPLVAMGQTIKGVIEGDSDPAVFIPKLVELYRAGLFPFDRLITTYPLSEINRAVNDHHSGACVKAVLLP